MDYETESTTVLAEDGSSDIYSDVLAGMEKMNVRLITVTVLIIVIIVFVILGLLAQGGYIVYELMFQKKKKQEEKPSQIVIQKPNEKKKKESGTKTSSSKSMKSSSRSRKGGKDKKKSSEKETSCGSSKSIKTCSESSRSCPYNSNKQFPSKEIMLEVEIDNEEGKDGKKKKTALPPPTVDINMAAPPPYSASQKDLKSDAKSVGENSEKSNAAVTDKKETTAKDSVSVSMGEKDKTMSASAVSPATAMGPSSLTAIPPTATPNSKNN